MQKTIFVYIKNNMISAFSLHLFSYIIINLYLLFIDWFSDKIINWSWIPALIWLSAVVIHYSLIKKIRAVKDKSMIIGFIISDQSGRALVCFENDKNTIENMLGVSDLKIEMVPMFFNALQSFSEEINLKGCNQLELNGINVKVLSINKDEYSISGFILPKTDTLEAKRTFENILEDFLTKNKEKFSKWEKRTILNR